MKLSTQTTEVLKNFSTINQNIMILSGDTLKTVSAMKNIVATAKVPDNFVREVPIYNLNEFLSVHSLFSKPLLNFDEKFLTISEDGGSSSCKYHYSDPSVIVTVDKDLTMPTVDVEVVFTESIIKKVNNASGTLGVTDLVLTGVKDKPVELKVKDKKNSASNNFAINMGTNAEADFEFYFKVENLKLLPGDYDVQVSSKGISFFKHKTLDVTYFIALEPESTYKS